MLRSKFGCESIARAHFEALIVEASITVGDDRSAVPNGGHLDVEHERSPRGRDRRSHVLNRKDVGDQGRAELPGARVPSAVRGEVEQKSGIIGVSEDRRGRALSQTETI